jgi:AcrR family transcriptional regulator
MTASRRDHLVRTALELFRKHGYQATGIEKILTRAGVSKPTLYRHFDSKDELIVAALERWDEESRAWLTQEMARRGSAPREQVLALFDALADWFESLGFQGCLFINATVEFGDPDNPIHRTAAAHKRRFAAHVRGLLAAAGAADPDELAAQLMILMEGAIVTAQTHGSSDAARRAKGIAAALLAEALDRSAPQAAVSGGLAPAGSAG